MPALNFELDHNIRDSLSRRKAICLDTNAWIDLTKEKNNCAREIAFVEVMTISGLDTNRGDSMNDFYDREMMINPLAYGDVVVSQGRWIKSMMARNPQHLTNPKLKFFGELGAFKNELRSIQRVCRKTRL